MENNTFIEELKTLALNDDALAVSREMNELKTRFEDFILEEDRKNQLAAMEAKLKDEEHIPIDSKSLKDAFHVIYNVYRERRKEMITARNSIEAENLKKKITLITRLKDVIEKEENIGAAYNAYKEIHDTWKNVGDIAREKRAEIQHEYSRLLEDFFYNMKIYRELKDHDLKRNLQLKVAIIGQLDALKKNKSIKEIETKLKVIQNEWEEIGPVANDAWESMKVKYWANVRAIYDHINHFYDERRTSLQENIDKKKELLKEGAEIIAGMVTNDSVKLWDQSSVKLVALQEKWKSIGFGPRKENEEIWQEFRGLCDQFFAKKKEFFGVIQQEFGKIAEGKQKLIDQAKSLKDSTDWKNTADKLVQLQRQWKSAGHAGQKLEQKLWSEFRGTCDAFFNSRQKHFVEQDKLLEINLLAKQTLIQNIGNYQLPTDKKQALSDLKEFTTAFNTAGKVPLKEKDTIFNAYKIAIDTHYKGLNLEGKEKEQILFEARIETLSGSPDAGILFAKEKASLRQQIENIKSEILQFENNLGFFARSKGADVLRNEVEANVNASKEKIETLISKIKLIPNE